MAATSFKLGGVSRKPEAARRVWINVARDEEAGVFIATSPDLPGLIVEAASREALAAEVNECIAMLIQERCAGTHGEPLETVWAGEVTPV